MLPDGVTLSSPGNAVCPGTTELGPGETTGTPNGARAAGAVLRPIRAVAGYSLLRLSAPTKPWSCIRESLSPFCELISRREMIGSMMA